MAGRKVTGTAADPLRQHAKVEIDGNTYRLVYDFNAIAVAESVSGCNLLGGLESLTEGINAAQFRGLWFAALLAIKQGPDTLEPGFTIDDAGRLIRLDTKDDIALALAEAYRLSMPEKKKGPPVPDAPPAGS